MKRKVIIPIVVIVVLAGLAGFKLASNKKKIDESKKVQVDTNLAIPVTVAEAYTKTVQGGFIKTGSLIPFREANIMASAQGKVTQVYFDLGSNVREGQVLVSLDAELKQLGLQQTELLVSKLENDYDRYSSLLKGNAATEVSVNDIKYNYDNAKNQAAQIKKQISDASIQAPVSGIITKKNIEKGEYVNPGTVLGTMVDVSKLKVKLTVNEREVYTIVEKQPVNVTTSVYPGEVFKGEVTFISPAGDAAHNYAVEITLENHKNTRVVSGLKSGTIVNVEFTEDNQRNALLIPRNALPESLKTPYVYVVKGNIVEKRDLKVGAELGDNVEVLGGLAEGEIVVVSGQINLKNGSRIEAIQQ